MDSERPSFNAIFDLGVKTLNKYIKQRSSRSIIAIIAAWSVQTLNYLDKKINDQNNFLSKLNRTDTGFIQSVILANLLWLWFRSPSINSETFRDVCIAVQKRNVIIL